MKTIVTSVSRFPMVSKNKEYELQVVGEEDKISLRLPKSKFDFKKGDVVEVAVVKVSG